MKRWRVPLPRGAEPPYRVFVNGVPAEARAPTTRSSAHELHFTQPLEKERLGVGRWTAMFLGLWGSYGKNDSVDVQYRLAGRDASATGLDISLPPRHQP